MGNNNAYNSFFYTYIKSIVIVQLKLVKSADNLGLSLVKSYANEEEYKLHTYENMLLFATQSINDLDKINEDKSKEIQEWLQDYFFKMENIIGKNIISPYAVINGEIIAATPWEGDDTYEYEDKDWYKNAVEANGEVVYSNVYSDAITNKYIYTISKELEEEGNIIAIDIYK